MKDKKIEGTTIIDRNKLENVLKFRIELLEKVEKNLIALNRDVNVQNEQVIGLRHRVNELQELLK